MDTKWKNRKKGISFIIFVLGVTLTLGSAAQIFRDKPSGVKIWQLNKMLEDDYQTTGKFRKYIANRLEIFLIMATGGRGLENQWLYYNYGGYPAGTSGRIRSMWTRYWKKPEMMRKRLTQSPKGNCRSL